MFAGLPLQARGGAHPANDGPAVHLDQRIVRVARLKPLVVYTANVMHSTPAATSATTIASCCACIGDHLDGLVVNPTKIRRVGHSGSIFATDRLAPPKRVLCQSCTTPFRAIGAKGHRAISYRHAAPTSAPSSLTQHHYLTTHRAQVDLQGLAEPLGYGLPRWKPDNPVAALVIDKTECGTIIAAFMATSPAYMTGQNHA